MILRLSAFSCFTWTVFPLLFQFSDHRINGIDGRHPKDGLEKSSSISLSYFLNSICSIIVSMEAMKIFKAQYIACVERFECYIHFGNLRRKEDGAEQDADNDTDCQVVRIKHDNDCHEHHKRIGAWRFRHISE